MAAGPRSEVVRKGEPGIYHVWTRTVRQAFLCGYDQVTGNDYTARRAWIRAFEEVIAGIFAIEIAFRCEMSNHVHLVLKVEPDVEKHWSDTEVVTRWLRIKRLIHSRDGQTIKEITNQQIAFELAKEGRVEELRLKLADISEFMKALCEYIARRANREEDRETGTRHSTSKSSKTPYPERFSTFSKLPCRNWAPPAIDSSLDLAIGRHCSLATRVY